MGVYLQMYIYEVKSGQIYSQVTKNYANTVLISLYEYILNEMNLKYAYFLLIDNVAL